MRTPHTRSRRHAALALAAPVALALAAVSAPAAGAPASGTGDVPLSGKTVEFSVLGAPSAVPAAVRDAGGTIVRGNKAVGLYTAKAPANGFAERLQAEGVEAAPARAIGHAPAAKRDRAAPRLSGNDPVEAEARLAGGNGAAHRPAAKRRPGMDPLDDKLWGLKSVRSDLARTKQPGDRRVKVGILDTGVDASHPDIAPNFDRDDSRNFVRDIPTDVNGNEVDGPCEFRGCVDPVDHDDGGHGTHVAGTVAAAANGFGVSGVAPKASIVNIRGGQDSGNFFLQPVVDALTYAGDAGLDAVNMSFYVDPWLYNCTANSADNPKQQAQQRLTVKAVSKALNYAHGKGVTLVAALGNEHTNIGAPQDDTTSPNYPAGNEHPREIDNKTCLTMPTEGPHVLGVGSYGPSQAKADYSNYGTERISVAAPGGYARDYAGTPDYNTYENTILSSYPRNVLLAEGQIDEAGNLTKEGREAGTIKQCTGDACGYYAWLQGTSMASPHATGVAALIVSQYGHRDSSGLTMSPDRVRSVIEGTAAAISCPVPRTVDYTDEGRDASFTATCKGGTDFNDFYGHGSVDAWSAVTHGSKYAR